MVKNLPAVWKTRVWSLGQEDLLEKGMATHSSILAGECHGQRSLAGHSSWDCKELNMAEWHAHTCARMHAHAHTHTHTHAHTHTHRGINSFKDWALSQMNYMKPFIIGYKMADYSPKGELLQRNLYLCGNQSLRQKEQKLKESSLVCDRQREGCLPSHCIWNNPFRLLLPSRPPNVCGWLLWQTCIFLTVRMNLQFSNRWISPGPT